MMNYTDRVNRLAVRPRRTDVEQDPFIKLTGMLAATLCNAADHGHVTSAVHRQLEEHITRAEIDMNARP